MHLLIHVTDSNFFNMPVFFSYFCCISLKYTNKKHYSAFINKYGNIRLFDTVVWVLSKKNSTNIFLLKNAKREENQILVDLDFTWKVFVNALFRWKKQLLAKF